MTEAAFEAAIVADLDAWTTTDVVGMPGETVSESQLPEPTGDPSTAAQWIDVEIHSPITEQLAFDGSRLVTKELRIATLCEPVTGASAKLAALADALVTLFNATRDSGGSLATPFYRTEEARLDNPIEWGDWLRRDWICEVQMEA